MHATTVTFPAPRQVALVDDDLPPPGPDEILVEGLASLISTGTELTAYSGDFPPGSAWARYVRYPFAPGYSYVGRVAAAGAQSGYTPGERVAGQAPHGTAACLKASQVLRVPEGVSDEQAAFRTLGCTVMNGVRLAGIGLGDAVAVVGAGLLGQLCLALSALSGAWPLISIDVSAPRLALAASRGATHTLTVDAAEAGEAVREILGGRGADVVFEVTGSPQAVPAALRLARRRGKVILLGSSRGPSQVDFHDEVHTLGLQVVGAHTSTHPQYETPDTPWTWQRNGRLFLDLAAAGRVRVDDLISHRFSYRDAPQVYEFLLEDRTRAMGVIFSYPLG